PRWRFRFFRPRSRRTGLPRWGTTLTRSSPKAFKLNPAAPKWRPASFVPTASMEVSVFQAPKPSYRPAAMGHHPHQVGHFCFLTLWSLSFVLLVLSAYRYHRSLPYNAFRHSNMGHTGHHPRRSS
ncbi:unnamed protein product, partial [Ascophyllum nodosum]